jgi:ATP/ADP translocase
MTALLKTAGRWGGILTLIILLITLVRQLIELIGFLIAAIKIGIVVLFVGVMVLIVLSILRARKRRRKEAEDI